ncbi:20000_t:CDS:2, partial [Gigaspora rosea]
IEYENGDVFIANMCIPLCQAIIALLQRYFNLPNSNVIFNHVLYQPFHPSPSVDGFIIAPDIALYPNRIYVPWYPHVRIMCEIAISK